MRWSRSFPPRPSTRTAGRLRISQGSLPRSAIFRSSRPAKSSRCQRVCVSTIQPLAERRVYRSLVYQSQIRCRTTGLSASSRLPKGSSIIAPSAALPAIALPTPAESRKPRRPGISKRPIVRRAAALGDVRVLLSSSLVFGKMPRYSRLVIIRCTSRFMLTARSLVWLARISRRSGFRPSMKAGKRRETSSLLPCWGGMKIISRGHFPLATRSSFSASSHGASWPYSPAWCGS